MREPTLVTQQYYHVFNRGVEKRPLFTNRREYLRMLETINYYRFLKPFLKLSRFLKIAQAQRNNLTDHVQESSQQLISIVSFVLIPNHFHFLVQQNIEDGISKFIKHVSDSYARYFNTIHDRVGPLFQGKFKAVLIESDEQLTHVSRYIHLNPYSSYLVKSLDELKNYPWSSLPQYLDNANGFCQTDPILNLFSSPEKYAEFVFDQADYQRRLEDIKHLTLE